MCVLDGISKEKGNRQCPRGLTVSEEDIFISNSKTGARHSEGEDMPILEDTISDKGI